MYRGEHREDPLRTAKAMRLSAHLAEPCARILSANAHSDRCGQPDTTSSHSRTSQICHNAIVPGSVSAERHANFLGNLLTS